jgi:hypothetical protein
MALVHYRVEEKRTACGREILFRSMQTTIVVEKTTCEWCIEKAGLVMTDGPTNPKSTS